MRSGMDTKGVGPVKSKATVMIAVGLVVLVASFALLFIYQYQALGDTIEQERITYVSEIKEQLVDNITTEKYMQMSMVSLYCRSILKALPERFSDLEDILDGSQTEEGDEIFLLDERGAIYDLYGNKKRLSDHGLAQRRLLNKEDVFSYAQVNNTDEYWFYGAPLEDITLDGIRIRAVLSARNIENFGSGMATSILNNEGYTFVTSHMGNVLLYPPLETDMGYSLFNSLLGFGASEDAIAQMREDFRRGKDGQAFLSYGGNRWLISYSSNVFDDWVVVVLMPMTITAADTYRMLNYTMIAVALLVGSILILLLFSINLFYRRERAREQSVEREKMELEVVRRTAESKNQLAKMSHDIRTPLNAIMGLLQITKGQVTGQPKVEKNLSQVEQSAEYLKNLFRPFEQESPDVALTYAGSGLGLSIVKNLVELMGGEISVSSAKGKGSRFEVSLRLSRTRAPEDGEASCEETLMKLSLAGRKLLLAEDNELNAMIATELITDQFSMQVDWAENGQVALEHFEASAPGEYAAVLMDIRMPVMDGLEATVAIRKSGHPCHRHVSERLCRGRCAVAGAWDERSSLKAH